MELKLIDFEFSNGYCAGTLTVEWNNRVFKIEAIDGVHKDYRYKESSDHILTGDEHAFNRWLFGVTDWSDSESFNWSEKKQMWWSGECETDDEWEPIENDDGQWITKEEYLEYIGDLISDAIGYDCDDEMHLSGYIENILEKEAALEKQKQDKTFFNLKFANTPIIQQRGLITRIYDRCGMKDGEEDYCIIIGERCGKSIDRVLMIADRIALVEHDNQYWNVYVNDDEADAEDDGVDDWNVALERFNELVEEEEYV